MALVEAQNQVATALKALNDCPESVKQLLLTALPSAFGPNVHKFQQEAAVMLRKSLQEGRAAAGEAEVTASQRVKEAQTVLEALQADVAATTASEEVARTVLSESVAALEAAETAVKSEEAACKEAEEAKAVVAAERQKFEAAKAEVESVQNGSFRMLLDGGWEDEEVRDACIDAVCSYLKAEKSDVVLLAALPKALLCKPAECSAFDKIAIDEALRIISEKVTHCTAQITEGEEQFEDVSAEYLGAWAIADVAREKSQAASTARDSADAAVQSAIVDTKLAQSKVLDQNTTLATLQMDCTFAEAKVTQLNLALSGLATLEAGEEAIKESNENAMEVDQGIIAKENAMVVDLPIATAA